MKFLLDAFLISGVITLATAASFSLLNEKCDNYKKQFSNPIQQRTDNGTKAQLGEFPHIAALAYADSRKNEYMFRCGGSLISNKYILMPGHCAITLNRIKPKFAMLGAVDVPSTVLAANPQTDYNIKSVTIHPRYHMRRRENNIAIAELEKAVIFNDHIRPVCLYSNYNVTNGQIVASELILGEWRQQNINTTSHLILYKTKATYVPMEDCSIQYAIRFNQTLSAGQICAYDNNNDTYCEAQLGGPLQIFNGKLFTLVGVPSHGSIICSSMTPTVYTFVYDYLDWIKSIIWA